MVTGRCDLSQRPVAPVIDSVNNTSTTLLSLDAYAMHMHITQCMLWPPHVHQSVKSRWSIETAEMMELVFVTEATVGLSYAVL